MLLTDKTFTLNDHLLVKLSVNPKSIKRDPMAIKKKLDQSAPLTHYLHQFSWTKHNYFKILEMSPNFYVSPPPPPYVFPSTFPAKVDIFTKTILGLAQLTKIFFSCSHLFSKLLTNNTFTFQVQYFLQI